jgi:hypothetical protein
VQFCKDDFNSREASLWLDVNRDTASLVANFNARVLVENDFDAISMTSKSLIDRVIDDLPKAVHQASAIGGTDIHTRPFTDSLEPL